MYRDAHVCVTGGAGFIGSHLVDALVNLGAHVTVIDDLSNGREENISASRERIRFIQASILDDQARTEALRDARFVFHQAALGSVPHSVEEPLLFHEVNGTGTLRVLETSRRANVQRVVYASSSSVYGDSPTLPKVEDHLPTPKSPYAASKLMGEYWMQAYAVCYGLSGVALRYFNVFGPRQRPDSQYAAVVPAFVDAMLRGRRPVIYGDGGQSRDFTYVRNVVYANLLAAIADRPLAGEAVNVACGERFTLLDLLGSLANLTAREPDADHAPERAGDVRHSQADIARSREIVGYETTVGFDEGLRETVEWFRSRAPG